MKRREFITLLGGAAAAWPLAARAQQPAMPVIGFLNTNRLTRYADRLRAFRQGLKDTGYVEGENVAIEYRWAENQIDRLPALAAELVRRQVAVIAAAGDSPSALAAKAATTTIPIVFAVGEDPVRLGLVASLARPGGNLTGINFFNVELAAKRLELLRELVPAATRVAVLVNPANATNTETTLRDVAAAARAMGLQIQVLNASTSREIDAAFATFVRERPDALFVGRRRLLHQPACPIGHLASRHAIPATYSSREFAEAGGLMSYGTNIADAFRQVGVYTGRILKGAKPADLPVVQATKFELVINAETARMLGLDRAADAARPRRRGDRMKRRAVHHAARRRGGGVAARGARAAGRADAAHRRAHEHRRGRSGRPGPIAAFLQGLQQLGWTDGRNVRIDIRWGASNADRIRELRGRIGRACARRHPRPGGTAVGAHCYRRPRTVPIVFTQSPDPVGAGFVESLARPGGNATGFTSVRIRHQREMAGAAQGDRAARDASGSPSRSAPYPPGSASSPQSRPWRRRSGSS